MAVDSPGEHPGWPGGRIWITSGPGWLVPAGGGGGSAASACVIPDGTIPTAMPAAKAVDGKLAEEHARFKVALENIVVCESPPMMRKLAREALNPDG